jgi:PEP-CTERM motif
MNRFVLGLLAVASLFATTQASAATVYFRGAIALNAGGDTLGLLTQGQGFEVDIRTNNAGGILGNYIVFLGKSLNFSTGTFAAQGPNNVFTATNLTDFQGNPAGTLTITIPGPIVADSQAGLDSLIGRPGGIAQLVFGGSSYLGGIVAVPEPSSMLALTGLVVGCGAFARRRRAA